MKTACILLINLFTISAFAADTLEIKNGDFEKGKQFWRGGGKIITEKEGNKVCELKATQRGGDEVSQDLDLGKNKKVEITLRMKGISYDGTGLRLTMSPPGGGGTYTIREVTEGAWTDMKFMFTRSANDEKYNLTITTMGGKGSIQIDNVKISSGASADP